MRKKKILICSEAHYLNSGYGVFYNEILKGLHANPNYIVAEFASYGKINNPLAGLSPWRFYANSVEDNDPRHAQYKLGETNIFGEWRIDKVLLDFRPDIVFAARDIYSDTHIIRSPLAKYCHTILSAPIDSAPQKSEWLDIYSKVDSLFTYSDYGTEVLRKECPGINLKGILGAGVDFNVFKPMNKKEIRRKYNLPDDLVIFGTVMRNQKRKLFPSLITAFANLVSSLSYEQGKNLYLYLHTAYPDRECWDIPGLIKESGVSSRILTSYLCRHCQHTFAAVFQDAKTLCQKCKTDRAVTPNVTEGYNNNQLAEVYNLFDFYLQVATCEGLGIPQIEASSCGIPFASIDYSAMSEIIHKLEGYKIQPECLARDFNNDAMRAVASTTEITKTMADFLNEGVGIDREKLVSLTKQHFNWPDVIGRLTRCIDSAPQKTGWNSPPVAARYIPDSFPVNLTGSQFVDFLYYEVLDQPEDRLSYFATCLERDLHYGVSVGSKSIPLDKNRIFSYIRSRAIHKQECENIRSGQSQLKQEDFLEFANKWPC